MPWVGHDVRGDENAIKLTGPVGDRLAIRFLGPVQGWGASGWAGTVRKSLDGAPVATFEFDDNTTNDVLDLVIIIEDTTMFTPGCKFYFDIRAISGPAAPATPFHGTIVSTPSVTPLS